MGRRHWVPAAHRVRPGSPFSSRVPGATAVPGLDEYGQRRDSQQNPSGDEVGGGGASAGEGDGGNRRLAVGDVAQRHDLILGGDGDGAGVRQDVAGGGLVSTSR